MPNVNDRRGFGKTRYPAQRAVLVDTHDATGQTDRGACRNVSVGGACVAQGRPMRRGAVVELTLHLRPGVTLSVAGRVIWARPNDRLDGWVHGIRFSVDLHQAAVADAATDAP